MNKIPWLNVEFTEVNLAYISLNLEYYRERFSRYLDEWGEFEHPEVKELFLDGLMKCLDEGLK